MPPRNLIGEEILDVTSLTDSSHPTDLQYDRTHICHPNSVQFELGPPNEQLAGKQERDKKKLSTSEKALDHNDPNLFYYNQPNNSGPASLDLTKDISVRGLRPKVKSQSMEENEIKDGPTASDISARIIKNGKQSSSNSSNSSGNFICPSTGSSLISNGSQASVSSELSGQASSQGGSNGKGGKKKSWYNALYPTYKSRADDFKKIFSALPQEEKLIVEYSCALQRDILVHGRLYVTKNYLCFYANIFRWETSVALRWKDVIAITKEKTALVIPNAIQITTESDERHFFTSFAARDRTYMMLFKLWQNALLDQPASSSEIWRWVHSVYGDELGLTSEDDPDYVYPNAITFSSLNDITPPQSLTSSTSSKICYTGCTDGRTKEGYDQHNLKSSRHHYLYDFILPDDQTINNNDNIDNFYQEKITSVTKSQEDMFNSSKTNTDTMDPSNQNKTIKPLLPYSTKPNYSADTISEDDSLDNLNISDVNESQKAAYAKTLKVTQEKTFAKRPKASNEDDKENDSGTELTFESIEAALASWKSNQEGREIVSQVFPVKVDELFSLLFNNSKFYNKFQDGRKTFDMVQNEWVDIKTNNIHYSKTRDVSFTLSLTHPMGPKHSRVTETQQLRCESEAGQMYFIDVDTANAGIPYADSFYVELSYCLSKCDQYHGVQHNTSTENQDYQYGSRLTVFAAIKYKKTVWGLVKTFIEKNTWAGLEEFFLNLAQALHNECELETCLRRNITTSKNIRNEKKLKRATIDEHLNDKEYASEENDVISTDDSKRKRGSLKGEYVQ